MDAAAPRRNSWLACPSCGHKVGRARTCDIEFKCKYCGYEFEVIIKPVRRTDESSAKLPEPHVGSHLS